MTYIAINIYNYYNWKLKNIYLGNYDIYTSVHKISFNQFFYTIIVLEYKIWPFSLPYQGFFYWFKIVTYATYATLREKIYTVAENSVHMSNESTNSLQEMMDPLTPTAAYFNVFD